MRRAGLVKQPVVSLFQSPLYRRGVYGRRNEKISSCVSGSPVNYPSSPSIAETREKVRKLISLGSTSQILKQDMD